MKLSDIIPEKYFVYIPDKLYIRLVYLQQRRKLLSTRHPRTYCEKIQWIKMYGHLERYAEYADKYAVRPYVTNKIGAQHLIPLLGSWESFEAIPFDTLPDRFVLKGNHGSGYNFICKDKSALDKKALGIRVSQWLSQSFYQDHRELQYRDIKPRIVAETYIEDESGELKDYKFYCFNGVPTFIEVHYGRTEDEAADMLAHVVELRDMDWDLLPYVTATKDATTATPKPKHFPEMLKIARKLAEDFPFVRVDLYYVHGKIYFGELTFVPGDGYQYFGKADKEIGDMLDLSGYKQPYTPSVSDNHRNHS